MDYEKKTAVFRQIEDGFSFGNKHVGGIARIETLSGVSDLYLTLVNFIGGKDFFAFVIDSDKKVFKFKLSSHTCSAVFPFPHPPSLSRGFAIGISLIKDGIPLTIAFARSVECDISPNEFKKELASFLLNERKPLSNKRTDDKRTDKPIITPTCGTISTPTYSNNSCTNPVTTPALEYNDEIVATVNYFDFDKTIEKKLEKIKELDNEKLRLENELPFDGNKAQTGKTHPSFNGAKNETNFNDGTKYSNENPFYQTVKRELNEIFYSFPTEEGLQNAFLDSKFAKVFYSDKKYYTVGVINEDGIPRYVCYGVPSTYSPTPPQELKGFCSFIPLSVFDLKGEGYWMIFQDAITGECIKP